MSVGVIFKIHDLPVRWPMEGMSFHASESPLDRILWDGEHLEIVLKNGEVWSFDFAHHRWDHTETLTVT